MTHVNLLAIAATEAKAAAASESTLEAQLRAAMCVTRTHWLVTDEDDRFKAAVAAVFELSDPETQERLGAELQALRGLAEGKAGALFGMLDAGQEPVGLLGLWREVP
jgi:hypothetical protein